MLKFEPARRAVCFLTFVSSATLCLAQTVLLDFNTVGQYTNNFNPWQDSGGANGGNYCYAETTNAGVNGSGGALGNYSAGCAVYDYGTDGVTPGANLLATNLSHTGQTDIAGNAIMWPALRGQQNAGVDVWDNFLVYRPDSKPVITLTLTNT